MQQTTPFNPRESFVSAPRQRVINPSLQHALFAPGVGTSWLRLIPPHARSMVDNWLYDFQVYDLAPRSAGFIPEIAVPSSLLGAPAVVDRIQIFSRFVDANYPHFAQLRGLNRTRPLELWAKDRGVCWVHVVRTLSAASRKSSFGSG